MRSWLPLKRQNEALKLEKDDFIENALSSFYALINLNFRFPIFEGFKGVLFYDLGLVFLEGQKNSIFKLRSFYRSGFSLPDLFNANRN